MKLPGGHYYGKVLRRFEAGGFILTETEYTPDLQIPSHSHEHSYFTLVKRGSFREVYGKRARECGPLALAFHPADETHSERFSYEGGRSFNIEVGREMLERIRQHSIALDGPADFSGGRPSLLALSLYEEFYCWDEVSPIAIEGLALELIAEVARLRTSEPKPEIPAWLRRAREILEERFAENLTVSRIAMIVGVHPVYLATSFRRQYRCTIGESLRKIRIDFACREISGSARPLVEIALAAGFSHQSHFSRTFKRLTGFTPAQYRTLMRLNQSQIP